MIERKRILRAMVPDGSAILYANHIDGIGTEFFKAVCAMDLEGIVAKHKQGLYKPEATTWVKIKNQKYSQAEGRRELFEQRRRAAGT